MKKLLCLVALMSASIASAHVYTGLSGGWFKSRDVESWGGGAHVGFELADKMMGFNQGVELEVWGLQGRGHANESVSLFDEDTKAFEGTVTNSRTLKLTQVPVMVNYRLWGTFDTCLPLTWYAGAGIGFQWVRSKDHSTDVFKDTDGVSHDLPGTLDCNKNRNQIFFTGQLFAGLGYQINEAWSASVGTRVLMAQKQTWADPRAELRAPVHMGPFQVGVELGLNYAY